MAQDGLAQVFNEQDQFQQAAEYALEAVSLQHHFPEAHFHLGVALRGLQREEDAIAAFETSLSMGHGSIDTHAQLASLYRRRDPLRANQHAKFAGIFFENQK